MVIGYHLILSTYGFWLPNDPRGSCSRFVGAKHLFRFGKATTVSTRRSVAAAPHDRKLRRQARTSLQRPAIRFSGIQARAIARGFAFTTVRYDLPVWACSLLPDHAHWVIGRTGRSIESVAAMLKADATRQMLHEGLHPFAGVREKNGRLPSIWASGIWKVFLSTPSEVHSRIGYVERNPVKAGYRAQRWPFVTPYEP
jgi:REP element-mobilizing transposase RayT